ncbi:MAG: ABC transporter permease, partial [Planctomycetota bacterium]
MYKLFVSFRYLRTTRVAVLPIACVTIGVIALLLVTSVMGGFSRDLRARIRGTASHLAVFGPGDSRLPFADWEPIADAIRRVPGVVAVSPHLEWPVLAGQRMAQAEMIGIDPSLEVKVGQWGEYLIDGKTPDFTLDGVNQSPPGAILGCDMLGRYRSRDYVILVDRLEAGADPGAFKRIQLRAREVLRLLNRGDRFTVIAFGGGIKEMSSRLLDREAATLERAERFLDRLSVGGVPNALEAMRSALVHRPVGDRTFRIVVVSAGRAAAQVRGVLDGPHGREFWGSTTDIDADSQSFQDVREVLTGTYRGGRRSLVSGRLVGGNFLTVNGEFTIVGMFNSGMSEYDSNFIYVPLEYAQKLVGAEGRVNRLCVAVQDYEKVAEMRETITKALSDAGYGRFSVITWEMEKAGFLRAVSVERQVTSLLMACVTIVAGFCVLAILLMLVREKTRDIGILRSLGATVPGIALTFLLEGFLIGLTGTVLGLVIGFDLADHLNEVVDYI